MFYSKAYAFVFFEIFFLFFFPPIFLLNFFLVFFENSDFRKKSGIFQKIGEILQSKFFPTKIFRRKKNRKIVFSKKIKSSKYIVKHIQRRASNSIGAQRTSLIKILEKKNRFFPPNLAALS